MTEENMENETPKNDEEQQPNAENESEKSKDESNEELDKSKEYGENQKIRAEKAEAENKKLKADAEAKVETKTPKKDEQSDETDNTERLDKLTLKSEGITHIDDAKVVLDEAKRLQLPVEEVMNMEHIKSKLKDAKDQREAEDGMPEGKGKSGSGNKTSVEHWVNKKDKDGNYITPDDLKLANEVIDARVKQQEEGNKFSDQLY